MNARPWVLALLCLALPAALGAKGHKKALPAPAVPSVWRPDRFSLQGGAMAAIPLSPRGPGSFAVSYGRAFTAEGGFFAHWGSWGLGLEGTGATFAHQQLDHSSVTLLAGALVLEKAFWPEEGSEEGPLLQLGAGWGTGSLESVYPGPHAWAAPSAKAGIGYRLPLAEHWRLDLLASGWGLLGDGAWDPVFMGQLGAQVGVWW